MNKEELIELKRKLESLSDEDKKKRDLYLKRLSNGTIEGPLTGYASIDKPWLKYYSDEQINAGSINKTAYQYLYTENVDYLNDVAIIFANRKISYNILFKNIKRVAKSLIANGVKKGDVVTICLPNTPEAAYLFYACSMIGAIADFIDPRENDVGLQKYLNISQPEFLVMLDMCFDNFKKILNEKSTVKKVIVTSAIESLPLPLVNVMNIKNYVCNYEKIKEKNTFINNSSISFLKYKDFVQSGELIDYDVEIPYEENRPVAIVHSGGTTGIPKGVLLSNDNLNELTNQLKNSDLKFLRHYLLMGVMPEFVGYGLSVGLHTSLVCGMKTLMIAKYEPDKIPELIIKYKPNCMAGSPAHWETISKSELIKNPKTDLSFFKAPIEGGDTLNIKTEENVNEILMSHGCEYKIQKGYGMTEKCSAATVCFNNQVNELGSVGAPFTKTILGIFDPYTNQELQYNENGEICICAPDVMLGYYNNDNETKMVLKKHEDEKTWLHSGDIGYLTENGLLYVVGRIKDIIIRFDGIKIYPLNFEKILNNCEFVDSSAIIGVPDENHLNGELPVAFVSCSYLDENIKEKIKEYIYNNFIDYAVPVDVIFVDNLPKTKVGKVDKKSLKELYIDNNKKLRKK